MRATAALFALTAFAAAHAATPAPVATITGIASAENAIQASDGRIYVSSDGTVYRIDPPTAAAPSWGKTPLAASFLDGRPHGCYYLGLAESSRTVFALCTENSLDVYAPKHLMAIDPPGAGAPPALREVGALQSVGLPNGLAADGQGHLYYANTGILYPGSVHKVTLAGTSTVVSDVPAIQFLLENPNGLKIGNGQLYVGTDPVLLLGTTRVLRYPLGPGGPGLVPTVVSSAFGFYDDFSLVAGSGLLLDEFLLGQVQDVDEPSGRGLQSFAMAQPTSATVISAGGASYLLVTQRGAGQASILTNAWNLQPR